MINLNVAICLTATLLMLCIMTVSLIKGRKVNKAGRAFRYLVIAAFVASISGLILEFIEGPVNPGPYLLAVLLEFIFEVCLDLSLVIWFVFSFFSLYDSMDYFRRKYVFYMTPFAVSVLFEIVNLFTGIFWYYDENVVYHEHELYYLWDIVRYFYLFLSITNYSKFQKENGKKDFFSIWIYVVPLLLGTIFEMLTGYVYFNLGIAVGTTLLYILYLTEYYYTDEESGFFNARYLTRIRKQIDEGKREAHIAIRYVLQKGCDSPAFFGELKKVVPKECDTVRTGERSFLTLIYSDARGLKNLLAEDIQMIAEDLNTDVVIETFAKNKDESAADFFTRSTGRK
ncbi:MAG: hypothetical protein IJ695_10845 [Butyrivibrio sp.]|nr:hypothetical protein [Butyrivibrio sp.]